MTAPTTFPLRGQVRLDAIRQAIRSAPAKLLAAPPDPATYQIADLVLAAVPDADLEEIATALRFVGDEQLREAEQLEAYARSRGVLS